TGDGLMTEELKELLKGSETIVAHTQQLLASHPVHNTIEEFVEFLPQLPTVKNVAFVHLSRNEDRNKIEDYLKQEAGINFIVPKPNQIFDL
ncbi:MAG: hypothetical protein KBC84_05265, partial [Proteobacteria bacterium]|nr:hypothetical protein [Pseudomonadota bacterium]